MSGVNDYVDKGLRAIDPRAPARAQKKAAEAIAQGQQDELGYLMAREELPLQ